MPTLHLPPFPNPANIAAERLPSLSPEKQSILQQLILQFNTLENLQQDSQPGDLQAWREKASTEKVSTELLREGRDLLQEEAALKKINGAYKKLSDGLQEKTWAEITKHIQSKERQQAIAASQATSGKKNNKSKEPATAPQKSTIEIEIALIQRKWVEHAPYAHFDMDLLLQAAAALKKIEDFYAEALRECDPSYVEQLRNATTSAMEKLKQAASDIANSPAIASGAGAAAGFMAGALATVVAGPLAGAVAAAAVGTQAEAITKKIQNTDLEASKAEAEENSASENIQEYKGYISSQKKILLEERKKIALSLSARLHFLYQQSDLAEPDLLQNLTEAIAKKLGEEKSILGLDLAPRVRSDLTNEYINEAHWFIAESELADDLRWLREIKPFSTPALQISLLQLEDPVTRIVLPSTAGTLIKKIEESQNTLDFSYCGPTVAQIMLYNRAFEKIRTALANPQPLNAQSNACDFQVIFETLTTVLTPLNRAHANLSQEIQATWFRALQDPLRIILSALSILLKNKDLAFFSSETWSGVSNFLTTGRIALANADGLTFQSVTTAYITHGKNEREKLYAALTADKKNEKDCLEKLSSAQALCFGPDSEKQKEDLALLCDIALGNHSKPTVDILRAALIASYPDHYKSENDNLLREFIDKVIPSVDHVDHPNMVLLTSSFERHYYRLWLDLHLPKIAEAKAALSVLLADLEESSTDAKFEDSQIHFDSLRQFYTEDEYTKELQNLFDNFLENYDGASEDCESLIFSSENTELIKTYFEKRLAHLFTQPREDLGFETFFEEHKISLLRGMIEDAFKAALEYLIITKPITSLETWPITLTASARTSLMPFLSENNQAQLQQYSDETCVQKIKDLIENASFSEKDVTTCLSEVRFIYPEFPSKHGNELLESIFEFDLDLNDDQKRWSLAGAHFIASCMGKTFQQQYRWKWFKQKILRGDADATSLIFYKKKSSAHENPLRKISDDFGADNIVTFCAQLYTSLTTPHRACFQKELLDVYFSTEINPLMGDNDAKEIEAYNKLYALKKIIDSAVKRSADCVITCLQNNNRQETELEWLSALDGIQLPEAEKAFIINHYFVPEFFDTCLFYIQSPHHDSFSKNMRNFLKRKKIGEHFSQTMGRMLDNATSIHRITSTLVENMEGHGPEWTRAIPLEQLDILFYSLTLKRREACIDFLETLPNESMDPDAKIARTQLLNLLTREQKPSDTELKLLQESIKKSLNTLQSITHAKLKENYRDWANTLDQAFEACSQPTQKPVKTTWRDESVVLKKDIEENLKDRTTGLIDTKIDPQSGATHLVQGVYLGDQEKLWFKYFPHRAGFEIAVRALHHFTFDPEMGYADLISLPGNLFAEDKPVPVLVSKNIRGESATDSALSLSHYWQSSERFATDPSSFSRNAIMAMIVCPLDQKPENILCEKLPSGKYALRNIDLEQCFARDILRNNGGAVENIGLRSALFCMDEMHHPLSEDLRSEILESDPEKMLRAWLDTVDMKDQRLQTMFTEEEKEYLFKRDPNNPIIITVTLIKGLVDRLFSVLVRIKQAVAANNNITHAELLEEVYPELARDYKKGWDMNLASPKERWEAVMDGRYKVTKDAKKFTSYGTTTNAAEALAFEGYTGKTIRELTDQTQTIDQAKSKLLVLNQQSKSIEVIRAQLLAGNYDGFNELCLDEMREIVIAGIDWATLDKKQSEILLQKIAGKHFRKLHVKNCAYLTNDLLLNILRHCPFLQELDLSGCVNISFSRNALYELAQSCKELKKLDLSSTGVTECAYVGYMSYSPIPFDHLVHLKMNHCPNLTRIQITAPKLTHLWAQGCPNLATIETASDTLMRTDFRTCGKIEFSNLRTMAHYTGYLEKVELSAKEGTPTENTLLPLYKKYPSLLTFDLSTFSEPYRTKLQEALRTFLANYKFLTPRAQKLVANIALAITLEVIEKLRLGKGKETLNVTTSPITYSNENYIEKKFLTQPVVNVIDNPYLILEGVAALVPDIQNKKCIDGKPIVTHFFNVLVTQKKIPNQVFDKLPKIFSETALTVRTSFLGGTKEKQTDKQTVLEASLRGTMGQS